MAVPVLTLKYTVPTSWIPDAHQSIWCGRQTRIRPQPRVGPAAPASTDSRYWRNPAAVKNTDPTKKVIESERSPTAPAYPGAAPIANRADPTANRTPIHQPRARGSHHVPPWRTVGCPALALRRRDSIRATSPSGRSYSMKVMNGPRPPLRPVREPGASSTIERASGPVSVRSVIRTHRLSIVVLPDRGRDLVLR